MPDKKKKLKLIFVLHFFVKRFHESLKAAATDMRHFATSEFSKYLVDKNNFGLIWLVVFKLGYVFWVWMNWEKSRKWQLFSVNM